MTSMGAVPMGLTMWWKDSELKDEIVGRQSNDSREMTISTFIQLWLAIARIQ